MNNATTRIQMTEALNQAFEAETLAAARCCLETALACTKKLAKSGRLQAADVFAVNETRMALTARGWC